MSWPYAGNRPLYSYDNPYGNGITTAQAVALWVQEYWKPGDRFRMTSSKELDILYSHLKFDEDLEEEHIAFARPIFYYKANNIGMSPIPLKGTFISATAGGPDRVKVKWDDPLEYVRDTMRRLQFYLFATHDLPEIGDADSWQIMNNWR